LFSKKRTEQPCRKVCVFYRKASYCCLPSCRCFYRKVNAFYRKVSAFYRKVSAFYRKVSAFYRKVVAFYHKVSAFCHCFYCKSVSLLKVAAWGAG